MRSDSYLVPVLVIVVALAGAVGAVWYVSDDDDVAASPSKPSAASDGRPIISPTGPYPKVVVDDPTFRFDVMAIGDSKTKTWTIRNDGEADLVLVKGRTTCQCTVGNLDNDRVPPGETAEITLTWTPENTSDSFDKGAIFYTNDPQKKEIQFKALGRVTELVQISQNGVWSVGSIDVDDVSTVRGTVVSAVEPFEITGAKPANPSRMSVSYEPMTPAELTERDAKAGYNIEVKLLPLDDTATGEVQLGGFTEQLSLATDLEDLQSIGLMVRGVRTGPISFQPIAGSGHATWNGGARVLSIGQVNRDEGKSVEMIVRVDGTDEDFEFAPPVNSHEELINVSISPREVVRGSKVREFTLRIEIPPKSRQVSFNHVNPAEIRLTSNHDHPIARDVRIALHFTVI